MIEKTTGVIHANGESYRLKDPDHYNKFYSEALEDSPLSKTAGMDKAASLAKVGYLTKHSDKVEKITT